MPYINFLRAQPYHVAVFDDLRAYICDAAHILDRAVCISRTGALQSTGRRAASFNAYSQCHSQAYEWYLWITRSGLATRQRELKKDLLTKKAELLRLSAKDHFAKYMKLKRSVDKGLADLEKLSAYCGLPCSLLKEANGRALMFFVLFFRFDVRPCVVDGEIASSRTAFSVKFNSVIWIGTTGVQFVVGWWYRKAAVFYLPTGWFGPLTWWLAFPFAPTGGRSFPLLR